VNPTFEQWLKAVLDHPVGEPEWYWASDFEAFWAPYAASTELTVEYMTRLFREHAALSSYSLEQVAQGVWFLIGESSPAQPSRLLIEPGLPLQRRIECVSSMAQFFEGFVAAVAPGPSRHDEHPFHVACYMWWDIFPSWGNPEIAEPEFNRACLAVMQKILEVPCELCQFSALHGLNHWYLHHGDQVERMIDAFLARTAALSPRVREYAQLAARGMTQ
jgi:hypothetical protein